MFATDSSKRNESPAKVLDEAAREQAKPAVPASLRLVIDAVRRFDTRYMRPAAPRSRRTASTSATRTPLASPRSPVTTSTCSVAVPPSFPTCPACSVR